MFQTTNQLGMIYNWLYYMNSIFWSYPNLASNSPRPSRLVTQES